MGIGYEHFINNRFFNKFNESLAVSGDSVLPFIGDRNIYTPIPMGPSVHVFRSELSNPNSSGFVPNPYSNSGANSGNYPGNYGPINSVYEIELSGIISSSNGLYGPDYSGFNGKFYVFFDSADTVFDADEDSELYQFQGTDIYENSWYGVPCNNTTRKYKLNSAVDRIIFSTIINKGYDNLPIQSGHYGLGVTFYGFVTPGLTNHEITYALDLGHIQSGNRRWMLEEEFSLSPVVSSVHTRTSSVYRYCNHDNSTCIIRPIRTGKFDLKNTNLFFNSKSSHYPNIFLKAEKPHFPVDVAQILLESGYHQQPSVYEVWFSGVTNKIVNSSCIPCSEYFSQKFQFTSDRTPFLSALGAEVQQNNEWIWNPVGTKHDIESYVSQNRNRPFSNGYLNICDYGCGDINSTYNIANNYCLEPMWIGLDNSGLLKIYIDTIIGNREGMPTNSVYENKTILFHKMIGSGVTSNLFDNSIYDGGWNFLTSGLVVRNFPISDLCEFSGAVPIIRTISNSGVLRCNTASACLPLCYDFRHPQTAIVSMTLPDGNVINRALTLQLSSLPNLNLWAYDTLGSPSVSGNRRSALTVTCGSLDMVFQYSSPEGYYIVAGGSPPCSGESVSTAYGNQASAFEDRISLNCSATVSISGSIGCVNAIFPINITFDDFLY